MPPSTQAWREPLASLLVAIGLLLVLPAASWADRGVSVDIGRIDVDEVLQPGGTYTLPTIGVRNPGSQAATYTLEVSALAGDHLAVPNAWVMFTPGTLTLDPGERVRVEPVLTIPRDAMPGDYETLLAAQLASDGHGARVGAAAASRLTFTVGGDPVGPDSGGLLPPADGVRGVWVVLAVIAGLLLLLAAQRLKGIRIRFERVP